MNLASVVGAALLCGAAPAREVLVYLANEPAPTAREDENSRRIASWLDSSPIASDRILAAGILEDLRTFPRVVDTAIGAIARHASALSGVVVASNRLLQVGQVLTGQAGATLRPLAIALVPPRDGREESNPLSNPTNVKAVLAIAESLFDPTRYEFVVVVESHGDELYAVTPRLGLPTEGLTRDALLERVHGEDNAFVERFGITTAGLLAMLTEERRARGFRTKLLVLASCESTIEQLPPEVPLALVAAGGLPLLYGAIDYDKVLDSGAPTLHRAFISTLTPSPFEIADPELVIHRKWAHRGHEVLSVAPYFAPLALWLAAFWLYRRKHRRARTA